MNNYQLEHLQSKYVGTGHADTTRQEWATHTSRDLLSSLIGNNSLICYMAVAENESIARIKYRLMMNMIQPAGPPLEKDDD
jgi:splicing factor 3B subunit 5